MKLSIVFWLLSLSIGLDLVTCLTLSLNGLELSESEISEASKLTPYYEKIERELLKNGAVGQKSETLTKMAKKILDKLDQSLTSSCLFETKSKKLYKKALELFISLEETVGRCDFESYKILAKNFVAKQYSSIIATVEAYRRMHAISCRSNYKEQYHQLVKTIDGKTLEAISEIIEHVQIEQFFPKNHRIPSYIDLLTINDFKFTDEDDAIDMLASRVAAEQTKDHPITTWSILALKDIVDEKIFTPCEVYRTKLANVLTPARFDGKIRDQEQIGFIFGDKEFKQAMINNRLCGVLLSEQDKLYLPLYERLRKLMNL